MASARPVSLRIPEHVRAEIEEQAKRQRRDFSSVANEMLEEAVRMRRIPGIVFADEAHGRAPWIAGTGLEVWEVVQPYIDSGRDWNVLRESFPWLSDRQLHAAIAYAEAYPEYIEECKRDEAQWTPEKVYERWPYLRPRCR